MGLRDQRNIIYYVYVLSTKSKAPHSCSYTQIPCPKFMQRNKYKLTPSILESTIISSLNHGNNIIVYYHGTKFLYIQTSLLSFFFGPPNQVPNHTLNTIERGNKPRNFLKPILNRIMAIQCLIQHESCTIINSILDFFKLVQ